MSTANLNIALPLERRTPLHLAAEGGHTTCVEHLLSTPGIDIDCASRQISIAS